MSKVALITGGGVGIGRGIALEMAKAGYDIALHCNSSVEPAYEMQEIIRTFGQRCEVIQANLTILEDLRAMFARTDGFFGRLDVFVGNAGLTLKARLEDMSESDFDLMTALNFKGNYFGIQEASRLMRSRQICGSIVLIASNNAYMQHPMCSCYGALKIALVKLCRSAAVELAGYRIRVNCIAPGWTDTGTARMGSREASYYHIPLRRWCTPEEIGKATLFLCGPYANSITGATLPIDGGASLQTETQEKYGYGE